MNALIRKGFLLAGVVMAANMFAVNAMKASDTENKVLIYSTDSLQQNKEEKQENSNASGKRYVQSFLNFLLSHENIFNLIGGAVFSVANNYFKWWDYKPGKYCKSVWFGWRSKKFLNGVLQFEVNFNLGRGAFWTMLGAYNFIRGVRADKYKDKYHKDYLKSLHVSFLVASCVEKFLNIKKKGFLAIIAFIVVFLVQGFVSMPLTLHISNFSISISLDSIIWMGIGKILDLKLKKKQKEEEERKEQEISLYSFHKKGTNNNGKDKENNEEKDSINLNEDSESFKN